MPGGLGSHLTSLGRQFNLFKMETLNCRRVAARQAASRQSLGGLAGRLQLGASQRSISARLGPGAELDADVLVLVLVVSLAPPTAATTSTGVGRHPN